MKLAQQLRQEHDKNHKQDTEEMWQRFLSMVQTAHNNGKTSVTIRGCDIIGDTRLFFLRVQGEGFMITPQTENNMRADPLRPWITDPESNDLFCKLMKLMERGDSQGSAIAVSTNDSNMVYIISW